MPTTTYATQVVVTTLWRKQYYPKPETDEPILKSDGIKKHSTSCMKIIILCCVSTPHNNSFDVDHGCDKIKSNLGKIIIS